MPDLGHALFAAGFTVSRYIPQADIRGVNTVAFHPDAVFPRNRYGVAPADVKGYPQDQKQHGASTFWLTPLFQHPAFLADHPQFAGVVVAEPPSSQDEADLGYVASPTLGGAYTYLRDAADMLGLLGSATATGPASSPGAPGVPGTTTPAPAPTATPPAPTPTAPTSSTAAPPPAPVPSSVGPLEALLEAAYPGHGDQLRKLVEVAGSVLAGHSALGIAQALPTILPLLGVQVSPKLQAVLPLIVELAVAS